VSTVSVIIPAFNADAYVHDAVNSALAQTHPDIEVIAVDDGSTDTTGTLLDAYGPRIRVVRQSNSGVAAARNAGLRIASGSWVAFLDADDVWAPDKIAIQLATIGDHRWSYTDRFNVDERSRLLSRQSDITPMPDGDVFVPLLMRGNFITLSSVLIRRSIVEACGGFHDDGLCEDWDLWLRVSQQHRVRYVREPLLNYRFTPTGLSSNHRAMAPARRTVVARALGSARGRTLPWRLRRQIWAETCRTNGWDAGRRGARLDALIDYARAAAAWPLDPQPYKEALKVCLNA
jgi:glycosyltransferase involved in cell wall biosynthesis